MMVAPIFGPVFGGWMTDSYSWRWLFYINLPVGATAIVIVAPLLNLPRRAFGFRIGVDPFEDLPVAFALL